MALLKNTVDATLSLHAEMFPTVDVLAYSVKAIQYALEESTPVDLIDDVCQGYLKEAQPTLPSAYSFFTVQDIQKAKSLIREAELGTVKRNGAAELVKCLGHIDTAKESLLLNIARIKDILYPKPIERRTLEQIATDTKADTVKALAISFATLPESVLRSMAQVFLGDSQIEYTKDELPRVIAHQQVLGTILEPGV